MAQKIRRFLTAPSDVRCVLFGELDGYRDVLRADPCVYCGGPGGTLDHIDPISLGGADAWMNLAGACSTCNQEKDSRPLIWFLFGRRSGLMPSRARFAGLPRRLRPMETFNVPPLLFPLAESLAAALAKAEGR